MSEDHEPQPGNPDRRGPPNSPELRRRTRRASSSSSASAAASAIASTVHAAEETVVQTLHILWDELPHWRRDNAFIVRGYRPTSNSYRGSLASLGYVHNESVNIWSHLLGALVFACSGLFLRAVVAPRYGSASAADRLAFACFFAGAFLCLGMSATYHALCNHSPEVAKWGNKLDYTGIVFLIVGSYVPALYYGFRCEPELMTVYLSIITLLGAGCLTVSWFEHFRTPAWRPYRALMFVGLGVSGVVPVVHSVTKDGFTAVDERMGLRWVLLQGALYILGAFIYAVRWPERRYPGHFDIWGSSHQIFHIFILFAAASHLYGMAKAFDFNHSIMGGIC